MRRMQLSLLFLSLQLAQIASVGDRHSENDGLGRRQAGQAVRGSRSRARLGSRLQEQEGRRKEGDMVTPVTIESSRSIRKGVRRAPKKTKKMLKGLDKADTFQVNKVSGFIR